MVLLAHQGQQWGARRSTGVTVDGVQTAMWVALAMASRLRHLRVHLRMLAGFEDEDAIAQKVEKVQIVLAKEFEDLERGKWVVRARQPTYVLPPCCLWCT